MTNRVVNFNPGPAALPLPALERAQAELLDYQGTGMSIMEHSHRGKAYTAVHEEAIALLRELMEIPDNYDVLLMQGGARGQFALLPLNLLHAGQSADYLLTGSWSKHAFAEAQVVGEARAAANVEEDGKFRRIPSQDELQLDPKARYVHITSNNTIAGTQYQTFPDTGDVPLVADMCSDILWRPTDVKKFGVIYAGAQKNLGPAGVTVVVIRKDLVEGCRKDIPKIFRYDEYSKANSLLNTAPTFAIYMMRNVLDWLKQEGGPRVMEERNRDKASLIYGQIYNSGGFYKCPVEEGSRSVMSVVFRLQREELEKKFIAEAEQQGLVGLKGHRSVGGIRASLYNAVPLAGVEKLADFMADFQQKNP